LIDQVVGSEKIWSHALQLSIQHDHPVYDTLFVATAEMLNDWVVTYDGKMLLKFSSRVLSPTDFFANLGNG
jgi:predicted nucleic acid-binding protein